jgi:hypothetical protein
MLSWHVFMKFNFRLDQRSTYLLWQPDSPETSTGRQNNVSIGSIVPKGIEYLYPACCGAILAPWTCWGTRKWNHQQARKRRFGSEVCWTSASFGSL